MLVSKGNQGEIVLEDHVFWKLYVRKLLLFFSFSFAYQEDPPWLRVLL